MLCGIRVEWPTDFVKQQACIAKEPKRALDELLFLHGKLEHVDAERTSLSRQSNKAERRLIKLERECDEQSSRARRSEHIAHGLSLFLRWSRSCRLEKKKNYEKPRKGKALYDLMLARQVGATK